MAYIKYVKLSQVNGISNGIKRILIAIPIVMIAGKTTIGFPIIGFLIYFKFIYFDVDNFGYLLNQINECVVNSNEYYGYNYLVKIYRIYFEEFDRMKTEN